MPPTSDVTVPEPTTATSSEYVGANEAVTCTAAPTVTMQLAVPVHAPLHPVNTEPGAAAAVSVTVVPAANVAVQVPLVQSMPAGELTTWPPEPDSVTDSANVGFGISTAVSTAASRCCTGL